MTSSTLEAPTAAQEADPPCCRIEYDDQTTITLRPHYGSGPVQAQVRYRWLGPIGAPVIVVQGGTSSGRRVSALASETSRGWWQACVGPAAYIDTNHYRVLALDFLVDLPGAAAISTFDQANALAAILAEHDIHHIRAHIGASYGGMVGLALAVSRPQLIEELIVISAAHRAHPMTTALRVIQRRIVELAEGHPDLEDHALALARALAVTTYRSDREFAERFNAPAQFVAGRGRLPVEDYLDAVGERFVRAISPARFRALSESVDLHAIDPAEITVPSVVIGVGSDRLVPLGDLRELARKVTAPCSLYELNGLYGHDTFLKEPDRIGTIVQGALR